VFQGAGPGHAAALGFLADHAGWHAFNLGTGQGHSVLDVVRAFEQASGRDVPCRIQPRRPGDVAACYADPAKARRDLGWTATRTLEEMCSSTWKHQQGVVE
jgi:UDP-glucose 4-epimerase